MLKPIERSRLKNELLHYSHNGNLELLYSHHLKDTITELGFSNRDVQDLYKKYPFLSPVGLRFEYQTDVIGITEQLGYKIGDQLIYRLAITNLREVFDSIVESTSELIRYQYSHLPKPTEVSQNFFNLPLGYVSQYIPEKIDEGFSIPNEELEYEASYIFLEMDTINFITTVLNNNPQRVFTQLEHDPTAKILRGSIRLNMNSFHRFHEDPIYKDGSTEKLASIRVTSILDMGIVNNTLQEVLNKIQFHDVCIDHIGCECRILD